MRKIISILSIIVFGPFFLYNYTYAQAKVNVYAVVGNLNTPPKVTYINPDIDPLLIGQGEAQAFSLGMKDDEGEKIYYTISTDNGTVSPTNGSINGSGSINFVYLSPSDFSENTKVYITLNDGVNFVVKEVNIYVY